MITFDSTTIARALKSLRTLCGRAKDYQGPATFVHLSAKDGTMILTSGSDDFATKALCRIEAEGNGETVLVLDEFTTAASDRTGALKLEITGPKVVLKIGRSRTTLQSSHRTCLPLRDAKGWKNVDGKKLGNAIGRVLHCVGSETQGKRYDVIGIDLDGAAYAHTPTSGASFDKVSKPIHLLKPQALALRSICTQGIQVSVTDSDLIARTETAQIQLARYTEPREIPSFLFPSDDDHQCDVSVADLRTAVMKVAAVEPTDVRFEITKDRVVLSAHNPRFGSAIASIVTHATTPFAANIPMKDLATHVTKIVAEMLAIRYGGSTLHFVDGETILTTAVQSGGEVSDTR